MGDEYFTPRQPVEDRELRKFKGDVNGDVAVNVLSPNIETLLLQVIAGLNAIYTVLVNETLLFLVDDSSNQLVDDVGDNLMG